MRSRFIVAAGVLFAASLIARADNTTFNFSFGTTSDPFSGSGMFTATYNSPGQYTITGISGAANTGGAVNRPIMDLLVPGTFPTLTNGGASPPNDNLLFVPPVGGGYFDDMGVSFELNNGAQINLYYQLNNPSNAYLLRVNGTSVNENVAVAVTQISATTPEPSSMFLLSTGVLGVAGMLRRRIRL